MAKKSKIIIAFLLVILMLISILQIKSLAANPNDSDMVVIKENDEQYLIYINGLLNEKFEFAFADSADASNLSYIESIEDDNGNSIAYVDSGLINQYFNTDNTYIWVSTENETLISGEKIVLTDVKTVQELQGIENITKNITVESSAEDEKIKINGTEGTEYYYKFFAPGSSEEYNKLLNLVNEISGFNDETDMFTKLQAYSELEDVYNSLVSNLGDDNWTKAENLEITKPYGAKENEQYVLWLKDSNGNIDVQFLTAYEREVTIVDEVEKTEEVTVSLPVTYDNMTGLFIALAVVVLAIVVIIAMKIISKKRKA